VPMGVEDDRKIVDEFFATRFGNKERAWELVHPDAIWIIPGTLPLSGVFEGRESIFADYLGTHTDDFETVTSEVLRTIAEPGVVVVEYHATGRTRKGRDYDTVYYYVVDVADGQITKVRQSLDTQYAQKTIYD
jgi:ketosteroid isomerase-like protein